MTNQAKLKSFNYSPIYKFGVQVPRNHTEAMRIDSLNNYSFWADAERSELTSIDAYETFTDKGKGIEPTGYKIYWHKTICIH